MRNILFKLTQATNSLRTKTNLVQLGVLIVVILLGIFIALILFSYQTVNTKLVIRSNHAGKAEPVRENSRNKKTETNSTTQPHKQPELKSKLLFGMGPTAKSHYKTTLDTQANIKLLTTWFNKPEDLEWMSSWSGWVDKTYDEGYAHQLIVYSSPEHKNLSTPYGRACGSPWAVSDSFTQDFKRVVEIFRGNGPLYISMFSEPQTYPCTHNEWNGNENYFNALKNNFKKAVKIAGMYENVYISGPVWGGWLHRWDDPAKGGGRSLLGHFDDIAVLADYQSFQAMSSDGRNPEDISSMTRLLSKYNQPIMLAHFKPDNNSTAVWDRDIATIFAESNISMLSRLGLFAFSIMDSDITDTSPRRQQKLIDITRRFGSNRLTPPDS